MFKEIWSKHADGKDAIREAWRIQLRLWLVAIVAIFLLWLRFSLAK